MDFSRIEGAGGLDRFMESMHLCVCGKRKKRSSCCFFSQYPLLFLSTCPWFLSHQTDFRQAGRNDLVPSVQGVDGGLGVGESLSRHFDLQH